MCMHITKTFPQQFSLFLLRDKESERESSRRLRRRVDKILIVKERRRDRKVKREGDGRIMNRSEKERND